MPGTTKNQTEHRQKVSKRMKTYLVKLIAAVALLALATLPAMAQLDATSGTNAVTSLNANIQNAGNVLQPVMLAVIVVMGCIGVYYRFVRKAKIGT